MKNGNKTDKVMAVIGLEFKLGFVPNLHYLFPELS